MVCPSWFPQLVDTGVLGTLNVVMPTVDIGSDLDLVIELFMLGHPKYGSAMLVPFLANYLCTLYMWWKNETKKTALSILAALTNFFPQFKGTF